MPTHAHRKARHSKTYHEMLERLQADGPGKRVVVHDGYAQDDNGPPCFDTKEEAERVAAKKGILGLALVELVPEAQ